MTASSTSDERRDDAHWNDECELRNSGGEYGRYDPGCQYNAPAVTVADPSSPRRLSRIHPGADDESSAVAERQFVAAGKPGRGILRAVRADGDQLADLQRILQTAAADPARRVAFDEPPGGRSAGICDIEV